MSHEKRLLYAASARGKKTKSPHAASEGPSMSHGCAFDRGRIVVRRYTGSHQDSAPAIVIPIPPNATMPPKDIIPVSVLERGSSAIGNVRATFEARPATATSRPTPIVTQPATKSGLLAPFGSLRSTSGRSITISDGGTEIVTSSSAP